MRLLGINIHVMDKVISSPQYPTLDFNFNTIHDTDNALRIPRTVAQPYG